MDFLCCQCSLGTVMPKTSPQFSCWDLAARTSQTGALCFSQFRLSVDHTLPLAFSTLQCCCLPGIVFYACIFDTCYLSTEHIFDTKHKKLLELSENFEYRGTTCSGWRYGSGLMNCLETLLEGRGRQLTVLNMCILLHIWGEKTINQQLDFRILKLCFILFFLSN